MGISLGFNTTIALRAAGASSMVVAATLWCTPTAHADTESVIAQLGEAFCPLIAEAGSNFASGAYQANGNGGIGGGAAGLVTKLVIENQCPSWMESFASGNLPTALNGVSAALNPMQSITGTNPLQTVTNPNPLQAFTGPVG